MLSKAKHLAFSSGYEVEILRLSPQNDIATQSLRHQRSHRNSLFPLAAILTKLAKHLALIACLMIVGEAFGRSNLGEVGIFFLVLTAAALHSCARAIQRRLPVSVPWFNKSP